MTIISDASDSMKPTTSRTFSKVVTSTPCVLGETNSQPETLLHLHSSELEDGHSSDDESAAGDHNFLNDLTLFEYFDNYDELNDDDSLPMENSDMDPLEVNGK